jgi:2-methylcitrate dehydratase PrpD
MSSPLVDALVDRCLGLAARDVAEPVTRIARHCLLDGFGVALAGSRAPVSSILRELVGGGPGACTVLGHDGRERAVDAALLNGVAMHALDFDDMHLAVQGHPTATILPAVLALAEQEDASEAAVLAALVVGVEVAATFGAWVNPRHYDAGWHATGTLGTIGAAGACAHLLRLDAGEWVTALALAATQAAGVRGTFGSMGKPLHAGRAAGSGLLSALLAGRGFSCARGALDGPTGFLGIHADPDRLTGPSPSESWAIEEMLFKFHAACYMTHAAIANARALADEHHLDPAEVETVEVFVAPELRGVCDIADPRNALEAKFSLQLTTALALAGADTADEETFTDEPGRADIQELRQRVRVRYVPELRGRETRARTSVTTRDGVRISSECDTGEPERDPDAREVRLVAKFRSLARKVLAADAALALEHELLHCPTGTLRPALGLARGDRPATTTGAPAAVDAR